MASQRLHSQSVVVHQRQQRISAASTTTTTTTTVYHTLTITTTTTTTMNLRQTRYGIKLTPNNSFYVFSLLLCFLCFHCYCMCLLMCVCCILIKITYLLTYDMFWSQKIKGKDQMIIECMTSLIKTLHQMLQHIS